MTGFCYAPREEYHVTDFGGEGQTSQIVVDVSVNGHFLKALLDTGSSLSLIKSCHVNYASTTAVQCVHGNVKRYPLAEVLVGVQDQVYILNVAVVDNLPGDMILGRDMPVLSDLLITDVNVDHDVNLNVETDVDVTTQDAEQSFPAVTRAQAKAGVQPLLDFDSSLLQGGTKGLRKTRRERCLIKYMGTPGS